MYTKFYQLKKIPFHTTPDPEFLFLSPSHKQALATIIYGVKEKKGFIALTGEAGLGKTTIVRSYLDLVKREQLRVVYIFNSNVSFESLLKTICRETGLTGETSDPFEMVQQLHQFLFLIEEYRCGRTVIIIDDAQNMPIDTLEKLHLLSNLKTSKDKLVQIILVGQPELESTLNLDRLQSLKHRIAHKATITPLTRSQSLAYIRHRLAKCMTGVAPIFTEGALRCIAKRSRGNPRLINLLCDNALIAGLGYQVKPVTARIAKEVINDFDGKRRPYFLDWKIASLVSTLLLIAFIWMFPYKSQILSNITSIHLLSKGAHPDSEQVIGIDPTIAEETAESKETTQSPPSVVSKIPIAPPPEASEREAELVEQPAVEGEKTAESEEKPSLVDEETRKDQTAPETIAPEENRKTAAMKTGKSSAYMAPQAADTPGEKKRSRRRQRRIGTGAEEQPKGGDSGEIIILYDGNIIYREEVDSPPLWAPYAQGIDRVHEMTRTQSNPPVDDPDAME
jgi:type II secretory pathway predicted ATPase ExeA